MDTEEYNRKLSELYKKLKGEDEDYRADAARELGELKDLNALDLLIAAAADQDGGVVRMAAKALGQLGDPRAVGVLSTALFNEDEKIRKNAAVSLGQIGDRAAIEVLLKALHDKEDSEVRDEAAISLTKLGVDVVPLLLELMLDKANPTRAKAAKTLYGFREDERVIAQFLESLDEDDYKVNNEVTYALGQTASLTLEALLEGLNSTSPVIRSNAAKALTFVNNPIAIKPLLERLEDEDSRVRGWAAIALGFLGATEAIPKLRQLAQTDTGYVGRFGFQLVKDAARDALREFKEIKERN